MRTLELWVRRLTGVSWGSGLTGRSAGKPDESEPDEEDVVVTIRRGV